MKTNKTIKLRDISALIGYSEHAARDLTRRTDADIKLWLKKHSTLRALVAFALAVQGVRYLAPTIHNSK